MNKVAKQLKDGSYSLTLSASRVDTYDKCRRKYYFSYLEKLPRKSWSHFDLGTLTHGTLELFHENYRSDDQKPQKIKAHMSECFKEQVSRMRKDGDLKKPEIISEAKQLLAGYLKRIDRKGIGGVIHGIEQEFDLSLGECSWFVKDIETSVNIGIKGYIDRLDKDDDGTWHIKDYKTTKSVKHMKPFQLQTYGIYLLDAYPEIERFKGSYIMMRHDGMPLTYDFNREDVIKVKRDLLEKAQLILDEERWAPKPSPLCDWCDFKEVCQNSW